VPYVLASVQVIAFRVVKANKPDGLAQKTGGTSTVEKYCRAGSGGKKHKTIRKN